MRVADDTFYRNPKCEWVKCNLPPVEGATLQPGTGVQGAGVKGGDAVRLELWEDLGVVLNFVRH